MDAAARRVRPVDLGRLATLRSRREAEARDVVRTATAARAAAEDATARAVRDVAAQEAERRTGERALDAALVGGATVDLATFVENRLRLEGLTERVAAARTRASRRAAEGEVADAALAAARARHAARASEADRWDRVRARILSARRAAAEQAEEGEAEDETLTRLGAARART